MIRENDYFSDKICKVFNLQIVVRNKFVCYILDNYVVLGIIYMWYL